MSWLVCDMDEGVLRRERTRLEALHWWLDHNEHTRVVERFAYAPGSYSYTTAGLDREDRSSVYIGTEEGARHQGYDTAMTPRFPYDGDRRHEGREEEE